MPDRVKKKPARIIAPKQERSAVTVKAIEQAIDELIAENGLDALTAQDAAKRAGVSSGTLYQYFRTREALIAGWELRRMQNSMSELQAIVADALALTHPRPIDDLVWTLSYKGALLVFQHVRHAGTTADFLSDLRERLALADGMIASFAAAAEGSRERARLIPKDLAVAVSVAVHATCFTAYARSQGERSDEGQDALAREIADMVTRYLVRPAP